MNSIKNKEYFQNNLIRILDDLSIKKLSSSEINFLKKKRILITGVSGVIGINLLFFFNKLSNNKKLSIHIDGTYNTSLFKFVKDHFKKNEKVNFIKIDLSKKKLIERKKYDLIFHCAGYGQPSKFLKHKDSTYKLNSNAIMNLKKNLKKNSKFVYMSTSEIYSGNNQKCTEKSIGSTGPHHARSSYIDSKKFGESYVVNCFSDYLIFRACLIYGPGVKMSDERVINQVMVRGIKNKTIDVFGGLKQFRSNLHISDAVNMIVKTLSKSKNQTFNLSNHKKTTLGKIFKLIGKLSKKKIVYHKSKMSGAPKVINICNNKILKVTNYKISTKIEKGLLKTLQWYQNLISVNVVNKF